LSKSGKSIFSDEMLHPGEILKMDIEARSYKKAAFAELLQIKPSQLSELLHGKRHISAAMALKLETILGISADYLMRV